MLSDLSPQRRRGRRENGEIRTHISPPYFYLCVLCASAVSFIPFILSLFLLLIHRVYWSDAGGCSGKVMGWGSEALSDLSPQRRKVRRENGEIGIHISPPPFLSASSAVSFISAFAMPIGDYSAALTFPHGVTSFPFGSTL